MSELPKAVIKRAPEDFRVTELPLVDADGHGDHLLVRLRKRNLNTADAAAALARWAGVAHRDVSWAGMKDRYAVTEQSYSVRVGGGDPDPAAFDADGIELVEVRRHTRKLRRGALRGNAFRIVLRGLGGAADAVAARVGALARVGVPNRFGDQRFGRAGENLVRARRWFDGGRAPRGREQRGLMISAARSALFNAVLDARIEDGSWDSVRDGDLMMFDRGRSRFPTDGLDEDVRARCAAGEIHPTGPLWGRGGTEAAGGVGALERAVAAAEPVLAAGLERVADTDRRPLRVMPRALEAEIADTDTLVLGFELPPGAYATVLLSALVDWSEGDAGDD